MQDIELAKISQELAERFYNLVAVGEGGRCPSRVNDSGRARRRQCQPYPSKPTTCHVQSIISSVPRADIHRAAPEPPQSKPPRRFGPIEADDGSSSEVVPDRRTGRATVVHPITHRRKRVPYPAASRWRSALGERVGFKGPSTPSDNSLPLRRCETGIPDGSKIVCIAMAATTFVARSA